MEGYKEQLERVKLMAAGNDTWDLSPNDTAALTAVLADLARLREAVGEFCRYEPCVYLEDKCEDTEWCGAEQCPLKPWRPKEGE